MLRSFHLEDHVESLIAEYCFVSQRPLVHFLDMGILTSARKLPEGTSDPSAPRKVLSKKLKKQSQEDYERYLRRQVPKFGEANTNAENNVEMTKPGRRKLWLVQKNE